MFGSARRGTARLGLVLGTINPSDFRNAYHQSKRVTLVSFASSQKQNYLRLVDALRPHWRDDFRLPDRIQKLLSRDKRFGSRDRRLYRELLYTTLRFLPWIEPLLESDPDKAAATVAWLAADLKSTRSYRAELTTDWPELPPSLEATAEFLNTKTHDLLPSWLSEECPLAYDPTELATLHRRASLWLRLQTDEPQSVTNEFDQRGWTWKQSDIQPEAIELLAEADVTQTESFRAGAYEVQDLGSQLILETANIALSSQWLDACAGAGGKTLQIARMIGDEGSVTAHDIRPSALKELTYRATRANLKNVSITTTPEGQHYDGILIDAPCSGSGTWRRAPHLKAITTPDIISDNVALQSELLERFSHLLRPRGQLIYATCSLNRSENEGVIRNFLSNHPEFTVSPPKENFGYQDGPHGLSIMPALHNTDGFFVANLTRT